MILNTREELNAYLNSFDFDSAGRTEYSNVYFLVRWECHEEPLYFFYYMGAWFESDCELSCTSIGECGLDEYLRELYEDVDEGLISHEKDMCRAGMHYEILSYQCLPFIEFPCEIVRHMTETELLDYLLEDE